MKAVLLAGGFGTRLRPLTLTRPKPLIPICGRPIIHHIVQGLAASGVDQLIVTTNYLDDKVRETLGDGYDVGLEIIYPCEKTPLGTAGSVKNAEEYMDETFLVIQCDNITDLNLRKMEIFHKEKGGLVTLTSMPVSDPWKFGVLKMASDRRVLEIIEKPEAQECFTNLVNTGAYMIEPEALEYIPKGAVCDFARDLFPKLITLGEGVYAYPYEGVWFDIGHIGDYIQAVRWFMDRAICGYTAEDTAVESASIKGPVTIKRGAQIEAGARIVGPTFIGEGAVIRKGAAVVNSMIEKDVEIKADASVYRSIIYEYSSIGNYSKLEDCIIAETCEVGDRVIIGSGAVLGAGCIIGDSVNVKSHMNIPPGGTISSDSSEKKYLEAVLAER